MTDNLKRNVAATPYLILRDALFAAGARCLNQIKPKDTSVPSLLEFWLVPAKGNSGRLVIVQHWTRDGGFDYYLQGEQHRTEDAVADVLGGDRGKHAMDACKSFLRWIRECESGFPKESLLNAAASSARKATGEEF